LIKSFNKILKLFFLGFTFLKSLEKRKKKLLFSSTEKIISYIFSKFIPEEHKVKWLILIL